MSHAPTAAPSSVPPKVLEPVGRHFSVPDSVLDPTQRPADVHARPFAAVDAQTREILQFELLRIWEERPTSMIFVTHSIEEAVLMGDRVFVLKGRPSNIQKIVEVDLPRPRIRETLRQTRFAELRELVWSTLMAEAREAEFHLERHPRRMPK
jgi:hypothetical protein